MPDELDDLPKDVTRCDCPPPNSWFYGDPGSVCENCFNGTAVRRQESDLGGSTKMTMTTTDAERVFGELHALSFDGVGITRPTYSKTETAAMMVILREAEAAGLKVAFDSASNLHVTLEGYVPEARRLLCGSHLDSVPQGGNYDGAAGVVAGLLAMINIAESGKQPRRSIGLVALRGEESAWFGKCYLGSRALFGLLSDADFDRPRRDLTRTLEEYMREEGGSPAALRNGAWILNATTIAAFLELHIEQGPVLEDARVPIGIVTGIRGNVRHNVTIIGEAGHSGTVPMNLRHDAVAAFAELVTYAREMVQLFDDLVMTVGRVHTDAARDSVSVIPDHLTFTVEWRSLEARWMQAFGANLLASAATIERRHGVRIVFDAATTTSPAAMDERLIGMLHRNALECRQSPRLLPSGAGHDAAVFAQQGIPTGMIFIRNQHGSHNPKEAMRLDDFALGVEVLERTLVELANE